MNIINPNYGINNKIIDNKVEKNDYLRGKIIEFDKKTGDAILKLINGGEIKAKIQGFFEEIPEKLVLLKVIDVSEDEIKLKLINENNEIVTWGNPKAIDAERLVNILNHKIPLTKENVELLDSSEKILNNLKSIENLDEILKNLLLEKGIDIKTDNGNRIFTELKKFAIEFKNLSFDDLLNIMENDIELTGENIKSYNNLDKKTGTIVKDINMMGKYFGAPDMLEETSQNIEAKIKESIKNTCDKIMDIMESLGKVDKEHLSIASNIFSKNLNDFKVYNSISNNYYVLDIPINKDNEEYNFKLIIKDERKKGKLLDKDNTNIAMSVKTRKMGTVDIFLKIIDKNMDVTFNAEKSFVSLIKAHSYLLKKKLSDMNYNVNIDAQEKKEDLSLASYNNFFSDDKLYSLNIYA